MIWAQRLRQVFNIDIAEYEQCQKDNVAVIACIKAGDWSLAPQNHHTHF
jgi:hypothetical protein